MKRCFNFHFTQGHSYNANFTMKYFSVSILSEQTKKTTIFVMNLLQFLYGLILLSFCRLIFLWFKIRREEKVS